MFDYLTINEKVKTKLTCLEFDWMKQETVIQDFKSCETVAKKECMVDIPNEMDDLCTRFFDCTLKKGASSGLLALPLNVKACYLNKKEY